ncbi:MAG: hypothetical protein U1F43_23780 [Myxococcota bacterium]
MPQGFDQLVSALQVRFDYQSSRIMVREALDRAGLKEQADYTPDQLQKFADGLNSVARNLDKVWLKIGISPSGVPLPPPPPPPAPPKAAKPPEPEPAPKAPEPEPVAAAPEPEPVVEAAPEPPPEPVVEAAPEPVAEVASEPAPEPAVEAAAEPAAESAPEETPSFFGGKKKKKKRDEAHESAPDGDVPPADS